jgi:RecA-family ATPase
MPTIVTAAGIHGEAKKLLRRAAGSQRERPYFVVGRLTKKGRVFFINLEIQRAFFAKRIRAVCLALQVEIQPGNLYVWNLRGSAADLSIMPPRLLPQRWQVPGKEI